MVSMIMITMDHTSGKVPLFIYLCSCLKWIQKDKNRFIKKIIVFEIFKKMKNKMKKDY